MKLNVRRVHLPCIKCINNCPDKSATAIAAIYLHFVVVIRMLFAPADNWFCFTRVQVRTATM